MRRGLWLFSYFGGQVLGHSGIAAEFAMADDTNRSMAAPAIDGNRSSAESTYVAGAAGSWRRIRRTTVTAGTARRPSRTSGSSGPIPVWRAPCCDAESKASKRRRISLRTRGHRRGNSVARRRDELGDRPLIWRAGGYGEQHVTEIRAVGNRKESDELRTMSVSLPSGR